ncbi:MAG: class I tRNA ligase family protein, partial [Alphaproteobacteria bacterium]
PVTVGRSEKMSKSRKNVVDPENIIANYGADTARLFMLSDSPPDRDLDWTDAGVDGAFRYLNRLYRMVDEPSPGLPPAGAPMPQGIDGRALEVRRIVHKTIHAVGDDIEKFHFNRAVARIREMSNALTELAPLADGNPAAGWVLREGLETLLILINPMTPHIAEELWQRLGHRGMIARQPWPKADPALIVDDTVNVAVQVNGKLRGTAALPKGVAQKDAEAAALAIPTVAQAMGGKTPRRIVFVPDKIVNIVV